MSERRSIFALSAGPRAKWVVLRDLAGRHLHRRRPGATCPASSPTPRRTSRPRSCPATPSRPRRSTAAEELQGGELAPGGDRLPARVRAHRRPTGRRSSRTSGALTERALPGRRRRRRDRRRGRPGGQRQRAGGGARQPRPARRRGLRRPDHADPGPARGLRAVRRPDLLGGRQGRDRDRLPQGRRRGRHDPRPDRSSGATRSRTRAAASR